MSLRLRVVIAAAVCGQSVLFAAFADAQINVSGTVNGQNVPIGTLTPNVSNAGQFNAATFQLNMAQRGLMNDAMGCQFRWYQVITGFNTSSQAFRDAIRFGNPPQNPVVPFVDPPRGGYVYQQPNGGADNVPFYENDDGGGPYAFPRYSDTTGMSAPAFPNNTPMHNQTDGTTRTFDFPNVPNNGDFVNFETYLVYVNPVLRAQTMFCVLAGYSWNIMRDNMGVLTFAGGNDVGAINAARLVTLNQSLRNSGFTVPVGPPFPGQDWQAVTGCELMCVPAPAAGGVLLMLGIGCVRRRR